MPRPAVVLVTGDRAEVIRRRETQADVFARDVMPEHLSACAPKSRVAAEGADDVAATG
ncbi:MAG: hypothetical protein ACE5D3_03660 [Candidatus Binatia bacterium]